jgi:ornithine carbamoyltransferase
MLTSTSIPMPGDLLRVTDLSPQQLQALLELAAEMKREPKRWRKEHRAEMLACYFSKPSTRTRVSFEAAAWRLGMLPVMLPPDELQLGRGGPIADTARVFSSYASAIVIRTFAQSDVQEMAAAASVPVINALTDEHHPCQALADLLTLRERFGELGGLKLAYVGDGNNVAHSLMEAGALAGIHVAIASPDGYEPNLPITVQAHEAAHRQGGSVEVTSEVSHAVAGANAIYTDVWVSMGEEAEQDKRRDDLRGYEVNAEVMSKAAPDAVFMPACLPTAARRSAPR